MHKTHTHTLIQDIPSSLRGVYLLNMRLRPNADSEIKRFSCLMLQKYRVNANVGELMAVALNQTLKFCITLLFQQTDLGSLLAWSHFSHRS